MKNIEKNIFGVDYIPTINFSLSEISREALTMVGKLSISGVQPKLSLKLNKSKKELEVASDKGQYILKPESAVWLNLPQNEYFCTNLAQKLGINVAPHTLLQLKDNSYAFVAKRFDRNKDGSKIHQENFLQILGKQDKYKGSLEEIGKRLKEISAVPGLDIQLFYERILYYFIIGNGDAHLGNFSISYNEQGGVRLSPAYDIVSSKLIIPNEEDMALPMNGKRNKITGKDFIAFADLLNIPPKIRDYMYLDKEETIKDTIKKSVLEKEEKEKLQEIVADRFKRLKKI